LLAKNVIDLAGGEALELSRSTHRREKLLAAVS